MVYCGLYPADSAKYPDLRDALEKLQVNDASLQYEPETSLALGFGFRCGFLGLLHLEIIQERLEREFNLDLVTTAPGVIYKVHKTNGEVFDLTNPSNLPDPSEIEYMEEPFVSAEIMVTSEYQLGDAGDDMWKDTAVAAVNHFRNAMDGEAEYLRNCGSEQNNNSCLMVERYKTDNNAGNDGVSIANMGGDQNLAGTPTKLDNWTELPGYQQMSL